MPKTYTEFNVVEKPIIKWLQEMGWQYVPAYDIARTEEGPLDAIVLRQTIKKTQSGYQNR